MVTRIRKKKVSETANTDTQTASTQLLIDVVNADPEETIDSNESSEPKQDNAYHGASEIHQSIGQLTRQLHDSLCGLGLEKEVEKWAGALPDTKDRLSYVTKLTGEAANTVLNSVDQAKAQQEQLAKEAIRIRDLMVQDPVASVAKGEMFNFLTDVEASTKDADQHLTKIMLAQDFHDLTGQVIGKVVTLVASIETQLLKLLLQTAPVDNTAKVSSSLHMLAETPTEPRLDGPQVRPEGNPEVVTNQSEVDDLLASLGF